MSILICISGQRIRSPTSFIEAFRKGLLMTNEIKLQPPQKSTVVESIIEQLVEQIRDGRLQPGNKLPSERQLIAMLGVSRSSVRESLQGIAAMGLVEIRQGEGTFVKEIKPNLGIDAPIDMN